MGALGDFKEQLKVYERKLLVEIEDKYQGEVFDITDRWASPAVNEKLSQVMPDWPNLHTLILKKNAVLGVPPQNFLEQTVIKYSVSYLDPLCEALAFMPNLTHLDLSENQLLSEAGVKLAEAIPLMEGLKTLSLRKNKLGDRRADADEDDPETGFEGGVALGKAFAVATQLTDIDVSDNFFGGKAVAEMKTAVLTNKSIVKFGGVPLLELQTDQLKELNLQNKGLRGSECCALAHGLAGAKSIEVLDCGDYLFGEYRIRNILARGGQTGINMLAEVFPSLDRLHYLDLKGNHIGHKGTIVLCKAFPQMKSLSHLNYKTNKVGDGGPPGGLALAEAFVKMPSLTWLSIAENMIDAESGAEIAEAFERMPNLKYIDYAWNACEADIPLCIKFASTFKKMPGLEELQVDGDHIGTGMPMDILTGRNPQPTVDLTYRKLLTGTAAILGQAINGNTSLKSLNLKDNKLTNYGKCLDEVKDLFVEMLPHSSLTSLNLGGNNLTNFGNNWQIMTRFGELLPSTQIVHLDLSHNQLANLRQDHDALGALAEALPKTRMETFNLRENKIRAAGCALLWEAFEKTPTLKWVNMAHNAIVGRDGSAHGIYNFDGIRKICEVLPKTNITELSLAHNYITNKKEDMTAMVMLAEMLPKTKLTLFDLCDNMMDTKTKELLKNAKPDCDVNCEDRPKAKVHPNAVVEPYPEVDSMRKDI